MTHNLHHRLEERAELKQRLIGGASILMPAPRRIGKTWLVRHLAKDMRATGWTVISIDVEGKQTEDAFLRALCEDIEKQTALAKRILTHVKLRFKQLTGNTEFNELRDAIGKVDARQLLDSLLEALNEQSAPALIIIDEIANFVLERVRDDPNGARSLLYHLRNLQQTYKNVRWLLTGSIGLDAIGRRYGLLGALLHYNSIDLLPFTSAQARSFLDEMIADKLTAHPFAWGDGAFEALESELGWLAPYYLRLMALEIRPSGPPAKAEAPPTATSQDVQSAVERSCRRRVGGTSRTGKNTSTEFSGGRRPQTARPSQRALRERYGRDRSNIARGDGNRTQSGRRES